jgi:CxxC motif-containing protein (DUF1111 family)
MRPRLAIAALLLIALSCPASALDEAIGRAMFKRAWVPAPSSTASNDGLGPLFNARSCASCHQGLDRQPIKTNASGIVTSENLVLRLSDGAGGGDPVYGRQLQVAAVSGVAPEGHVEAAADGLGAGELAYGPLAAGTRIGARVAQALRGLGELDTVPDDVIAATAASASADGVTGRVNWVMDGSGGWRVGRFGWKASQASLKDQIATAFLLDLGLSTQRHRVASGDCTAMQNACLQAPQGGAEDAAEMPEEIVGRVTAYLASIAPVTAAAEDRRGLALFESTGCAACHRPSLPGARGPVRAFTDLLLHDLGPEMDGGSTEPGVAATEWRTAPLWGLSRVVDKGAGLLHDGRAATLEEAIALHGGEASPSAHRFRDLAQAERERLLAFLKSL